MAATRTQKEIRQRAPIWLVMLLFANFVVMAVDARERFAQQQTFKGLVQAFFSPIQSGSSWIATTGGGFIRQITSFRSTAHENEVLKERLAKAELELRNIQEAKTENYRLQGLLALKSEPGVEKVFARVIARDASVWFNTITINAGSASGVALNMPVITPGGIVGRIVAVSPVTAQVMLITDEKAAAGGIVGQLGSSGALGSVSGLGGLTLPGKSGLVEMKYVSGLARVEKGDYVLTTGQDGIYPPGLNVGEVVDVKHGTATQPHEIFIRPSARLDQLTELAVLLYQPPQRPAPEQTLPNVDKNKVTGNK